MSVLGEASMRERKRWEKWLPWAAAAVLVAGIAAAIVAFVPGTAGNTDKSKTENPTRVAANPKNVPLSKEARNVAGRFILTAVRREHLGEAWKLSGPLIRQDLTYKEWLTGNIPVVPYTAPISITPMKVDYSWPNHALVEVAMVPKKGVKNADTELYWLELRRVGKGENKHWLVWSWVPRWAPPIRANPNG